MMPPSRSFGSATAPISAGRRRAGRIGYRLTECQCPLVPLLCDEVTVRTFEVSPRHRCRRDVEALQVAPHDPISGDIRRKIAPHHAVAVGLADQAVAPHDPAAPDRLVAIPHGAVAPDHAVAPHTRSPQMTRSAHAGSLLKI